MDLLVFAIITIYFIYKLNHVLGNRDYNYDKHKTAAKSFFKETVVHEQEEERRIDAKVELSEEEAIFNKKAEVRDILKQVRKIDKNFNENWFIKSASAVFEMVLQAFTQNDKNTLRMLLSNNIYQEFLKHIEEKERKQINVEQSLVSLKEVDIIKATLEGKKALLTIRYNSEQTYVKRDKDQHILEGNPSKIINKIDLWTFTRDLSKNEPAWELMSIE